MTSRKSGDQESLMMPAVSAFKDKRDTTLQQTKRLDLKQGRIKLPDLPPRRKSMRT